MHRVPKIPKRNKYKFITVLPLSAVAAMLSVQAFSAQAVAPISAAAPCAVIEDFAGQVEIMDPSRTRLIDTVPKAAVPCSGWVSVGSGWVRLSHRDGHIAQLGPETFAQFPDSGSGSHDSLVLYKGKMYGETMQGNGEFRILTASARAKIKKGSAIVVYSQVDDETQLIGISNTSVLENRFDAAAKITVRPGEGSSLDYRALRVVPTAPRAITLASLRPKLTDLHVDATAFKTALVEAKRRGDRKFAAMLVKGDDATPDEGGKEAIKPAGMKDRGRSPAQVFEKDGQSPAFKRTLPGSYARHPPRPEDSKLRDYLSKKTVAGQAVGEKILFPDVYYGRPQPVKIVVVDPLAQPNQEVRKEEKEEKARLIEELSQIRVSD